MDVYIYAADIYCWDCGEAICDELDKKGQAPPDHYIESMYDSGDYPKGPYPDGGGAADSPQHCGAGAECLNAIEFPDGPKVGAWLENELTVEGVEYVREAICEGGEVAEMWADFYCDYVNLFTTQGRVE